MCAASRAVGEKGSHLNFFEIDLNFIDGNPAHLKDMEGARVFLIGNIASRCGYTASGYEQMSKLQDRYQERGLVVLGAPCNQFGKQEPGSADDIARFANEKKAKFSILEKMEVNGPGTHDLYKFLKGDFQTKDCVDQDENCKELAASGLCKDNDSTNVADRCKKACGVCNDVYPFGGDIKWNFAYFLVNSRGQVFARYNTGTNLLSREVINDIESALKELAVSVVDEKENDKLDCSVEEEASKL